MSARSTVWIVDDSPSDAAFASKALAASYDVTTFHDGSAVLEALHASSPPDVVVLDWIMPGISGLEVCRFIRSASAPISKVVILLVTSYRATDQVVEGFAAGANDYLSKPYAVEELEARVGALARSRSMLTRVERAEEAVGRLLALTPDPMVVTDAHGRITFANSEAEQVLGPASRLLGRPIAEVVPNLRLGDVAGQRGGVLPLPDVTIGTDVFAPTVRLTPSDFEAAAMISLRDVTKRHREESRRLDFYSIMAHDMRSPLSSMLLRTDTMLSGRRGSLNPELTADLHKMQGYVRSMVALINDFLDLAQLDGGGYHLAREPFDLVALVRGAIDEIQPAIDAAGLVIEVITPAEPLPLNGDARRFMQVVVNLLSNAVKFTAAGGRITVTVEAGPYNARLTVADTGRGIAPDVVGLLFQRYSRHTSDGTGSGLGLMIVREIVEAHGGTVEVASRLGEGSTFTLTVPREHVPGMDAQILVVDDDADVRDTLEMLLASQGYTVATAENGQIALDRLRGGESPRVIVLDMLMPVMTGPELLERMVTDARLARIPVCAISGDLSILSHAPPGTLVLQKPVQIDRLLDFVARHAS
jgi:two-component system phosphate regulon sensor histidine kinase PhoR